MKYTLYMKFAPEDIMTFPNLIELAEYLGVTYRTASGYVQKGSHRNWILDKYRNADYESEMGGSGLKFAEKKDYDDYDYDDYDDDDDDDYDLPKKSTASFRTRKCKRLKKDYNRVVDSYNKLSYHCSKFIPKAEMAIFTKLSLNVPLTKGEKTKMKDLESQLEGPYGHATTQGMINIYNSRSVY